MLVRESSAAASSLAAARLSRSSVSPLYLQRFSRTVRLRTGSTSSTIPRSASEDLSRFIFLLRKNYSTETTNVSSGPQPPMPPLRHKPPTPLTHVTPPAQNVKSESATTENKDGLREISDAKAKAEQSADKASESILGEIEKLAVSSLAETSTTTTVATASKQAKSAATEKKPKSSLWTKIKDAIRHTWDGTRLLGVEIKISLKLAMKMLAGYELTRRESRQLKRTTEDLIRLVPFSVFIIVPFAELLLPVALKLFPNMLPSTFEGAVAKEKRNKNLRKTRKEVSEFLRSTVKESGLVLPQTSNNAQRELFAEFFRKVRTSGESPSREELLSVCRMFKDDIVLDNLSRPQLVAMARYMNLPTFGTDMVLRYQIRHRMRQTKRDDRAIDYEGVDSLSVTELQSACQSRGVKSHGVSPARLRDDLQNWLDLRLRQNVPSTLLLLSAAYTYGASESIDSHYDALLSVLSSIPDELYHEAELQVHHAEGTATNKQRLEVVKEQEELIKDENEEISKTGKVIKDDVSVDDEPVTHEPPKDQAK
ncbi:LETM1-like protein-domain-containing protein [Lipomyces doorenjongii]|uniref:LETM1-like protein-domain-containing protein n=1 Tax=Lipomyces doorenjongii TaxID=383834 RepID=UPI0034CFDE50